MNPPGMRQNFGKSKGGKMCAYCGKPRATIPYPPDHPKPPLWIHAGCTSEARREKTFALARSDARKNRLRNAAGAGAGGELTTADNLRGRETRTVDNEGEAIVIDVADKIWGEW